MTVAELTILRDASKAAYLRALDAQSYSVGSGGSNRSINRQKMQTLRVEWEYWQYRIDVANGDNRRVKFVTPRY